MTANVPGLREVLAKAGSIAAGRPLLGCYGGGGQKPPSNLTNIERHQCGYLALEKSLVRYQIDTVGRHGHFAGPPAEVVGADDREILAHAQKLSIAFGLKILGS